MSAVGSLMQSLREIVADIMSRISRANRAPEMNEQTLDACFDHLRSQVQPGVEVKISSLRKKP